MIEFMEVFVCKYMSNLNCMVWMEVIEDNCIIIIDCCNWCVIFVNNYRW